MNIQQIHSLLYGSGYLAFAVAVYLLNKEILMSSYIIQLTILVLLGVSVSYFYMAYANKELGKLMLVTMTLYLIIYTIYLFHHNSHELSNMFNYLAEYFNKRQ